MTIETLLSALQQDAEIHVNIISVPLDLRPPLTEGEKKTTIMPVYELENLPKVTEPVIGTPRGLMPEPTSHLCCSDALFSSLTAKAERAPPGCLAPPGWLTPQP